MAPEVASHLAPALHPLLLTVLHQYQPETANKFRLAFEKAFNCIVDKATFNGWLKSTGLDRAFQPPQLVQQQQPTFVPQWAPTPQPYGTVAGPNAPAAPYVEQDPLNNEAHASGPQTQEARPDTTPPPKIPIQLDPRGSPRPYSDQVMDPQTGRPRTVF